MLGILQQPPFLDIRNWTLPHLVDTEKSQYLLTKEDWHGIGEEAQII